VAGDREAEQDVFAFCAGTDVVQDVVPVGAANEVVIDDADMRHTTTQIERDEVTR